MRERGILSPSRYLGFASPDRIVNACLWWDQQPRAGVGVLVNAIKDGGCSQPPGPQRRERPTAGELIREIQERMA